MKCDIAFDIIDCMGKLQKLIDKILEGRNVTYDEAEKLLFALGFEVEVRIMYLGRKDI